MNILSVHPRTTSAARRRVFVVALLLVAGLLFSLSGAAIPPTPANGWITYTYYDAQGQVVGQKSVTYCPGMEPFAWGVRTNRYTYVTGICSISPER